MKLLSISIVAINNEFSKVTLSIIDLKNPDKKDRKELLTQIRVKSLSIREYPKAAIYVKTAILKNGRLMGFAI
ncbi:hypothetical protein FZC84_04395 [Rossellomorea vietnamensis]|uniref:Uncharacterized protein n=1 Tax=Rossellomorea vietnamensis TaxID=218284 RepID=A0A5D4MIC0_9BACI|nr:MULTISPECIES: hypothetical protein [Bacillaceae]TYS00741.1 hypothetical protein FZC84_04395 [Rossellomorea vietnamensis]